MESDDKFALCVESHKCNGGRAQWRFLMRAAIRETYEETGLLLGYPDRHIRDQSARTLLESAYQARGLCPAIDALKYIGRAITPRESSIRFNTHFFVADGLLAHGDLASNGELDDLSWRAVEECQFLPMADVTRFMLERAMRSRVGARRDDIIYYYVKGVPRVRRSAIVRNCRR